MKDAGHEIYATDHDVVMETIDGVYARRGRFAFA